MCPSEVIILDQNHVGLQKRNIKISKYFFVLILKIQGGIESESKFPFALETMQLNALHRAMFHFYSLVRMLIKLWIGGNLS